MEIGRSSLEALAMVGDDTVVADGVFKELLKSAFVVASGGVVEDAAIEKLGEPVKTKQAYAALLLLVLEAAKNDALPQEIATLLEDQQWSSSRNKAVLKLMERTRPTIRQGLSQTQNAFAQVVGIEWRLDNFLRSSQLDNIRQPVYFLTLKTQQPDGSIKDVPFSANYQELQDLLSKLKGAQNQVARLYQNE